jgi:hypothetical protein
MCRLVEDEELAYVILRAREVGGGTGRALSRRGSCSSGSGGSSDVVRQFGRLHC